MRRPQFHLVYASFGKLLLLLVCGIVCANCAEVNYISSYQRSGDAEHCAHKSIENKNSKIIVKHKRFCFLSVAVLSRIQYTKTQPRAECALNVFVRPSNFLRLSLFDDVFVCVRARLYLIRKSL